VSAVAEERLVVPAHPDVRADLVVRQLLGTGLAAARRRRGLTRSRTPGGQGRSRTGGEAQEKSAIDVMGHVQDS